MQFRKDSIFIIKQESISVGCVPPALHHMGGLCLGGLPDRDPPGQTPTGQRPLQGTWDQRQRPPNGT